MTPASVLIKTRQNKCWEAQALEYLNVRNGSIRFWGEWFGRPFDNYHTVIETCWTKDNDVLVIKFDQGEVAMIYNPKNIVSSEQEFSVKDASLITFEWFYYGREHILENLNHLEYRSINNNKVLCSGTDTTNKKLYKNGLLAMQII